MYSKCRDLVKNIPESQRTFDDLVLKISKDIGGDRRTQIAYITFMESVGFITRDESQPHWYRINKGAVKDDNAD